MKKNNEFDTEETTMINTPEEETKENERKLKGEGSGTYPHGACQEGRVAHGE